MASSLKVCQISKRFGETAALKGVSLDIEAGEFISLVGPSGCGKSTLLRIIAGLLPQTSGEIRIDDVPVDHLPPKARDIAMVFQSYALYPHMTVAQNIANPLRMRMLSQAGRLPGLGRLVPGQAAPRRAIQREVERVAGLVELETLLSRKPAALSGGQRQRVALARDIVRDPKIFLMDEPLSNLDARLRVTVRGEIYELHKRLNATFVYVTHDQIEAMAMSDRVAVMMDGDILQVAAPQELYENPCDIRVARFVGSPEINVLPVQSLRATAPQLAEHLPDLPASTEIAFRPEALQPARNGEAFLACSIERFESLGHNVLLFLRLKQGEGRVTARLTASDFAQTPVADGTIRLALPLAQLMAFNQDGRRAALA